MKGEIEKSQKNQNQSDIKWVFNSNERLNQKAVQIL